MYMASRNTGIAPTIVRRALYYALVHLTIPSHLELVVDVVVLLWVFRQTERLLSFGYLLLASSICLR